MSLAATPAGGLALYVHWPFCAAKCPYCDFNSHVRAGVDQADWRAALIADLTAQAARLDSRAPLASIFFGGGTPSLMPPGTVAAVIETAHALFGLRNDCEITLEANPTSVEAARFAAFRAAGIGRVSLGVQALHDTDLAFLGRQHSAAEALAALEVARAAFARVSFDLIYARPGQSGQAWGDELGRALALGPDHLSLYQLTMEPGTPMRAQWERGAFTLPDAEAAADLFARTQEMTAAAGLAAYEISNHARPGEESRHNLVYWRYGSYLGVGPGAHGRIAMGGQRIATLAERGPERWLGQVRRAGHGLIEETPVDDATAARELMLMGLRLAEGADLARYERLNGAPPDPARLGPLIAEGFLRVQDDRLIATSNGRLVLDAVLRALIGE